MPFAVTSQIARELGWRRQRVWRAIRRGALAYFQGCGGQYVIETQEAERFIAQVRSPFPDATQDKPCGASAGRTATEDPVTRSAANLGLAKPLVPEG